MARLAFLGSPSAAVVALDALVGAGHDVVAVVSGPDARRSRRASPTPGPVKGRALELGLPVTERLADVTGVAAELGVVVAYGRLVPAAVLEALPMVNVHFSLLPRWRGAAPVERAILAGDAHSGVCLMRLEEGLDTGPVLARRELAIAPHEHASSLTGRLAVAGAEVLVEVLADGVGSLPPGEPQRGEPTYAAKLAPEELRIDWRAPADGVERVVRLDRAWSTVGGERLRVLDARASSVDGAGPAGSLHGTTVTCGAGSLELLVVQPAGRRAMTAAEWRQGARPEPGVRLGDEQ